VKARQELSSSATSSDNEPQREPPASTPPAPRKEIQLYDPPAVDKFFEHGAARPADLDVDAAAWASVALTEPVTSSVSVRTLRGRTYMGPVAAEASEVACSNAPAWARPQPPLNRTASAASVQGVVRTPPPHAQPLLKQAIGQSWLPCTSQVPPPAAQQFVSSHVSALTSPR
ncbi:unnamed protein product, partial [Polarella glacialis]